MQQHPVPQNVTQYQFRLVGDMTLKQFLELAGGLVLAYLFYASNLIFFIKWPFALLSLFLGIALAFFPIEERPLDVWIINFLKSIYAPTRFIWRKTNRIPSFFNFTAHDIIEKVTATKTVKAPPTPSKLAPVSDLSAEELDKIQGLESLLGELEKSAPAPTQAINPATAGPPAETLKPTVTVRKLKSANVIFDGQSAAAPRPIPRPAPPVSKDVVVPPDAPPEIPKSPPSSTISHQPSAIDPNIFVSNPSVQGQTVEAQSIAQQIHLPAAPKKANLVVGMVVDREGHLVENAIVEIVTEDGIPARALKTNSLGQFFISTPLSKGSYSIQIEAEGLTFPPHELLAQDKLIPPLLLRAT